MIKKTKFISEEEYYEYIKLNNIITSRANALLDELNKYNVFSGHDGFKYSTITDDGRIEYSGLIEHNYSSESYMDYYYLPANILFNKSAYDTFMKPYKEKYAKTRKRQAEYNKNRKKQKEQEERKTYERLKKKFG